MNAANFGIKAFSEMFTEAIDDKKKEEITDKDSDKITVAELKELLDYIDDQDELEGIADAILDYLDEIDPMDDDDVDGDEDDVVGDGAKEKETNESIILNRTKSGVRNKSKRYSRSAKGKQTARLRKRKNRVRDKKLARKNKNAPKGKHFNTYGKLVRNKKRR